MLNRAFGEPYALNSGYWEVMAWGALFGALLGSIAMLLVWSSSEVTKLYMTYGSAFGSGKPIWALYAALAGLFCGATRVFLGLPTSVVLANLIEELRTQEVEEKYPIAVILMGYVTQLGSLSLGPEAYLATLGAGPASWISRKTGRSEEIRSINMLSGVGAGIGGLLNTPLLAALLVLEIGQIPRHRASLVNASVTWASIISFAIYFTVRGNTFLSIYILPTFEFEAWQLPAAMLLGIISAFFTPLVIFITVVFKSVPAQIESKLVHSKIKSQVFTFLYPGVIGAVVGLFGWWQPLLLGSGAEELGAILDSYQSNVIGVPELCALLFGKVIVFGLSLSGGFIGGNFFPLLFIGGVLGILFNVVTGWPLGFTFSCMFAGIAGSIVDAPFTLALLSSLTVNLSAPQTASVFAAAITAHVVNAGLGLISQIVILDMKVMANAKALWKQVTQAAKIPKDSDVDRKSDVDGQDEREGATGIPELGSSSDTLQI